MKVQNIVLAATCAAMLAATGVIGIGAASARDQSAADRALQQKIQQQMQRDKVRRQQQLQEQRRRAQQWTGTQKGLQYKDKHHKFNGDFRNRQFEYRYKSD